MLSDLDRQALYVGLKLAPSTIDTVEEMRGGSPVRNVSRGGLVNVAVDLYSPLMQRRLSVKSRTCQGIWALETELSETILEYWPLVALKRIERCSPDGRRTMCTAVADFLCVRRTGISIVECKDEATLAKLAGKRPSEWIRNARGWTRPIFEAWATKRGLTYEVWSPPPIRGTYHCNLQFVGNQARQPQTLLDQQHLASAQRLLRSEPMALSELLRQLPGFNAGIAGKGLAARMFFGTLKGGSIASPDTFYLSTDETRIKLLDAELHGRMQRHLSPITVAHPLLVATRVDLEKGRQRLDRVRRMLAGEEATTRRYRHLIDAVQQAEVEGTSALEVCLTRYASSGRTESRLTHTQEGIIASVIQKRWETGIDKTLVDLAISMGNACEADRVDDIPSTKTLAARVKAWADPDKTHLAVGGNRLMHAHRAASDPRVRSLSAIAPFMCAHVDSTKFDVRVQTLLARLPFACPTLFTAVDEATEIVLGRSLTFGPSSRYGLGLLLRDIVNRHGCLPWAFTIDGGSEFRNWFFQHICELYQLNCNKRPKSAGRFGALVENAFKRINTDVAHHLTGSTDPDKAGRQVDGKVKSYATAIHTFYEVLAELDTYLFGDWLDCGTDANYGTPRERHAALRQVFGVTGRPVTFDDDFILATSIPLRKADYRVEPQRGLCHNGAVYTSDDLLTVIGEYGPAQEWRDDCASGIRVYGKFPTGWVTAFENTGQTTSLKSPEEQMFDRFFYRDRINAQARGRTGERKVRHARQELLRASGEASRSVDRPLTGVRPVAPIAMSDVVPSVAASPEAPAPFATSQLEDYLALPQ